ncbi:MAG: hypothetical protein IPO16_11400 [Saprospiraceae bacterium]|nr:hypothetical protein [Saprospiraceae bacterium]
MNYESMNQSSQNTKDSEQMSIKDLVLLIRNYWMEYSKNRRLLWFCVSIGLLWGIYNRWNQFKIFEAELSFMLNEDQHGASGLESVIGQFGGLLGNGSDDINLQKILELGKSRRIAEKLFFSKLKIDEKEDYLANHLIKELERTGVWTKKPFYVLEHPLKGFLFKNANTQDFNRLENTALKQLHSLFLLMLTTQVSEKTSIMKLNIQCTHEQLSYELVRRLFDEMSNFYIDKTIEKQRITFNDLSLKTDSLRVLIHGKQYGLAGIKDTYRSTWLYQEEVPKTILDQDIRMLQLVYAEAMKNKEIASFSLDHKTPFIQAIDLPIMPLKTIQLSWIKALLLGLIYGLIVGSLFVFGRKFYNDHIRI